MRKFLILILIILFYLVIHEGIHITVAAAFNEFETVRWNVIGPEVIFSTPVAQREGFKWALISGVSNIVTLMIGYILLVKAETFGKHQSIFLKGYFYFLTILLMVADPLNLSIGPFFYGGDVNGIAEGLNIHRYWLQSIFLVIVFLNRELIVRILLPAYNVETQHFLFRPWFQSK